MKGRILWITLAGILIISPYAASAQILGIAVHAALENAKLKKCLGGLTSLSVTAPGSDLPIHQAMERYWQAAKSADSVSLASVFQSSEKAVWVYGPMEVRIGSMLVTDPYARASGNVMSKEPASLTRSNDGQSARGVWEVKNAMGGRIGYYLVDFLINSDLSPLRVELLPPSEVPPMVTPYCQKPGDIDKFNAAAKAMPPSKLSKIIEKATTLTTCIEGPQCAEFWARARQWIEHLASFPLVKDTDTLLLTSGPVDADLSLAYAVVLDPPSAGGLRNVRLRAWCGNMLGCAPSPNAAREALLHELTRSREVSSDQPH